MRDKGGRSVSQDTRARPARGRESGIEIFRLQGPIRAERVFGPDADGKTSPHLVQGLVFDLRNRVKIRARVA